MNPAVIAVAITGSVPRKKDNPAVPILPSEQIESTHQAFEAGATLAHIHVRNDDETPSSDPERFAQVQEGIKKHCPDMIVQFSTGGRGRDPSARGSALYLKPDMASLSTGSVNFPTIVYENSAALVETLATSMKTNGIRPEIEIFDLSHLHGARRLIDAGLIDARPHVQFVMGVKNAMPADEHVLDILLGELRRLIPKATWTAAGIGRHQAEVMGWALARGADAVRTGLEDNIRIDKTRLAASNAELVTLACEAVARHGRRVATAAEARSLLAMAG
ncbi:MULTISPECIES: 3-keto-5-aminohexanoate cleavage protein [Bradyrhizobium]|uniref:3-keto-5-aminohexanoate cleavage protein n=1 Tax=Bradyrhizobium yuanmingense TaxID=108015 RepID=A0A0R3C704_9BRAD|nr:MULTISPECIES: 3-keto-5-aminohexanoate cleavage protein [Bradyrhizobium]KRP90811.1 3-keto-5-aminohexanoate cleavage protein [Bradyrhizobium yuanmingense]MCA1375838.1 3-keto-5-aminohexanoate cleavage protein [Bradyrhizobium sp. IC4060]MCA1474135.1 3-keto-5-aminohexanoate cleavage protein [Bradyrhizobium sp. NBAIM08]MCA1485566.1 3-keto-5-aminohexanoate cleavage protein [Bradyrhizobium sp. IC4061]UWU82130.1 3-keto-5-aminohexanoate cleavage protein [Bradyrhizobium sp. CB1024]